LATNLLDEYFKASANNYKSSETESNVSVSTKFDRSAAFLKCQTLVSMRTYKDALKEFKNVIQGAADANEQLELIMVSIKSYIIFMSGRYLKSLSVLNLCTEAESYENRLVILL